jgi:hypothetical protein
MSNKFPPNAKSQNFSSFEYYLNKDKLTGLDVTFMDQSIKDKFIELTPLLPENARFSERIYWVKNKLNSYPKCATCGKDVTKFINGNVGYKGHCSLSCAKSNKDLQQKHKQKCLELHGVEHTAKLKETKEKRKATNLQKYGDEFPNRWSSDNFKEAMINKHGADSVMRTETYKKRITEKNKQNYIDNHLQNRLDEIYNKSKLILLEPYKGHDEQHKWKHEDCGEEFYSHLRDGKIPNCPVCNTGRSQGEYEMGKFISDLGFIIIKNDRTIIYPLELDIVIPELKIAIEYNGVYWHSDKFKDKFYHINKTNAAKAKGYQLIQIFEDEWLYNQEVVKSMLRHKLGCTENKVYARKCEIVELDEDKDFLNQYHIQGPCSSSIKLGLKYKDELVAVMSFGKSRFNKQYDWELLRYASKDCVIGGAGKLLAYFRKKYVNTSIISYCDLRYSTGELYKSIGFKFSHISDPSFRYYNETESLSRYQVMKMKKSHKQMLEDGYEKIFDCGCLAFVI